MEIGLKDIATGVGLIVLIGGGIVGYFVFQAQTETQIDDLIDTIEIQTKAIENHTKAINSLNERLIRMEEREKMRK